MGTPLQVDFSVDLVVKLKSSLPLEGKLMDEAVIGAIRAAREKLKESNWLSYRQQHQAPPCSCQEEEQERRDFKASLRIYHQAPGAEFVDPPPKHGKN